MKRPRWNILWLRPASCGSRVRHMAITLSTSDQAIPRAPFSARLSTPQVWGIVLLVPYALVFLAFVVYPVCYGLWLARHPSSYVELYNDPIFARAAINTLIFLVI